MMVPVDNWDNCNSYNAAKAVVWEAFLLLHLDYCNSLLYSISNGLVWCLQLSRMLLLSCYQYDDVQAHESFFVSTTAVKFKLTVIVNKSLHSLAPKYLVDKSVNLLLWPAVAD